jgi:hypothetical protein
MNEPENGREQPGWAGTSQDCQPASGDASLLNALEEKLQLIRDRTRGVAEGYANGFLVWGEGGTSKSYTIEQTLLAIGHPYKLSNSRITGKGLFELLRDYPDILHILEDVETLFADRNAVGVLRSALWGQQGKGGRQERLVVWHVARRREELLFTGGVILVANCPLDNIPQLRALKTRIACVRHQPSHEEVAALMRKIAADGHRHGPYWLPPEACREVADEVIARSQRVQRNLDLRLLDNTFKDRLQWENGAAETPWRDMLESRLRERVLPPEERSVSRAMQKALELDLVRRIVALPPQQRLAAWQAETGKSPAALYRRLAELQAEADSQFSEARQMRSEK